MEDKKPPRWLDLQGEAIFNLDESVVNMKDIPVSLIREMQVRASTYGGCVLFIDLSDFYGSEMFPMRKENEVYIYWGVPK